MRTNSIKLGLYLLFFFFLIFILLNKKVKAETWTSIGPDGGRITAIVVSPNYASDQTLFASSHGGGIFKSTDGGNSWTAVNTGLIYLGVRSLAISPNYAMDQTIFSLAYGIFKSTNGGSTWTDVNPGSRIITSLALSPNYATDQTIFAGTSEGVYKSTDGGETWAAVTDVIRVGILAISPNYSVDQTLFALFAGAVHKSMDGGITWAAVNAGLSGWSVSSLAISPNYVMDQTVFAGVDSGRFFKSTDGGMTWKKGELEFGYFNSVFDLVISPNYATDRTIFANGYKSTDGGITWTGTGKNIEAISPNYAMDQTVFGSGEGVFKSEDGGNTWLSTSLGLRSQDVSSLAISPYYVIDQTLFVGTYFGVYKSTDGGTTWAAVLDAISVSSLSISPNYKIDQTLFVGTKNTRKDGIYRSTDGGLTWDFVNMGWNINSLSISPNYASDQTVFAGTSVGVFKSEDGGNTWLMESWILKDLIITSLALSPNYATDHTIFAGVESKDISLRFYGIVKSIDGGATWTAVSTGLNTTYTDVRTIAISSDYTVDQTLYAGGWSGLYRSKNGGMTWESILRIGTYSIIISPNYAIDQTLFAGTGGGVYKSIDGGNTWTSINMGLGNINVSALTISPAYPCDVTFFAGTSASSVWKYVVDTEPIPIICLEPIATTSTASFVASTSVTLNGDINPNGLSTTAWFEWGTSSNLSMFTKTAILPVGYDNSSQTINMNLDGLDPNRTYYYRVVASSSAGTVKGSIQSVTTSSIYVIPTVSTGPFKSVSSDSAILTGNINSNGLATTVWFEWGTTDSYGNTTSLQSIEDSPSYILVNESISGLSPLTNYHFRIIAQNSAGISYGEDQLFTTPYGGTWDSVGPKKTVTTVNISPNYATDQTLFAGAEGVLKSTNQGTTWVAADAGIPSGSLVIFGSWHMLSFAISPSYTVDQTVFAGTSVGLYKSTNGGTTWGYVDIGGAISDMADYIVISPTYGIDQTIFVKTHDGLYKSTDGGKRWSKLEIMGLGVLAISPNYASDQTIFSVNYGNGVYKSIDGGTTWIAINNGLTNLYIESLAISPNYALDQIVFAGTSMGGIFKSIDGGVNWASVNTGLGNLYVNSLTISPNYLSDQTIFAGTMGGIFKSIDGGVNWASVNTGLDDLYVTSLAISAGYC